MAAFNVEMRQRVSGAFGDIIYPKAHWNHMDGKPSTFTPTAHTHGNITDDGKIGSTANLIVNTTTGGVLNTLAAGTTSQFLRGDGVWATPGAGGGGGITYTSIKNWTGGVNIGTFGTWNALNLTEDLSATGKYIIAWRYGSSSYPASDPDTLSMFIPGSSASGVNFSYSYGGGGYLGAWTFSVRRHFSVNSRLEVSNAWHGEVYDNGSGWLPSNGTNMMWVSDIYKVKEE